MDTPIDREHDIKIKDIKEGYIKEGDIKLSTREHKPKQTMPLTTL